MNIEEYRNNLHEDLAIAANVNMSNVNDEFIKEVTDILISGEEFDEYFDSYFEGITRHKANMRVDGYAMDDVDGSYCLIISDYRGPHESDSLVADEIKSLFKKLRYFVSESINTELYKKLEESSEAYELSKNIHLNIDKISKFRFYLLTDAYNKQRTKNIKDEMLQDKIVELNVWDITRIFDIVNSTTQKESVDIFINDLGYDGIPCVVGTNCIDVKADIEATPNYDGVKKDKPDNLITYTSYLAVVTGQILCDLYLDYGSRLLEGNVRSFLSAKGKVNKNIQNTIKNYPEMFFAYNNGIAATATEVDTMMTKNGLVISRIKDLQIVNGGQTTASIANAVLTAKAKEKVELSNLKVPMKISVLEHSMAERIIPKIAEYSNSQNKVDASDFFSNHPFHIRMEDFSRKTPAPSVNGNQFQQFWFYERARGQYNQGKMKLTVSEVNQYKTRYPDNQVIKMVDMAKYMELFMCAPDIVSKGKQAIVRKFSEDIKDDWDKSNEKYNIYYFKRVVAIAIMFKTCDAIIKNSFEYKHGVKNSYKANVVAYTLSIIFYYIQKYEKGKTLDFLKIWSLQQIYDELREEMEVLWLEVYDFITDEGRPVQNVTEYCKSKKCWETAKQQKWTMLPNFLNTLVSKEMAKSNDKDAKVEQNIRNEVDNFKFIWQLGQDYWKKLLEWGNQRKILYYGEQDIINVVIKMYDTGHTPTQKQMTSLLKTRDRLIREGMPIDF